jgi:uncharacterized protein
MDPVVHFEMPAENKKRMSEFYNKAFGWKTNQLGKEMGEYVTVTTVETDSNDSMGRPKIPGAINGGFYQKPEDSFGQYPSIVIAVENIEKSIEKVKAAGGKVHGKPDEIPGVGTYVSIIDTEGNRISLLQPLQMNKEKNSQKRELTLTRILDATKDEVWEAWTDGNAMEKWWGPREMKGETKELEAKIGGRIDIDMIAEIQLGDIKRGSRFPMKGVFKEIIPNKKLVFTSTAFMDGKPFIEDMKTITLEEHNGKTKMTVHVQVLKTHPGAEQALAGMEMGWNQTLDKLEEFLQ